MKNILSIIIVCLIVMGSMSTFSVAAKDMPDGEGIYAISGSAISELKDAEGGICQADSQIEDTDYYKGAVRFSVTCDDAEDGKAYMVYVLDEKSKPHSDNIYYINQAYAAEGQVKFDVFPKDMESGEYYVYVVGEGKQFAAESPEASYEYYVSVPVQGVRLNKASLTLTVGKNEKIVATIEPDNATNKAMTWESDNESVATVSDKGVISAKASGTALITVTTEDGNKTASCTVTVTEKKESFFVTFFRKIADFFKKLFGIK